MNTFDSFSFSASLSPESAEAMNDLWMPKPGDLVSLYFTEYTQARKHKKYRINKKWAKRYGMKPVTHKLENVRFENDSLA